MGFQLIDRIAVEEEGEGPAVVCVHGLGGSSNTYTPLMPALARHRVVRIDLPGSGRSQRAEGALSIERYVATLLDVCDRLKVTRAHWVGHSMGTIVCQHIAAAHPKRVASVALFGPLIAPPDAARAAMTARAAKAREGAAGMQEITQALLQGAISADTRQRMLAYAEQAKSQKYPVYWSDDRKAEHQVTSVCHLVLTLPEFQLD